MRDILTAFAGAVVLILVAALAVPPFIDWSGQRAFVEEAIARALDAPVRSEGRIDLRLLPSPSLRLDRLQIGEGPDRPTLDARFVRAEVALSPLLTGEIRFLETRIGRAELKLPVTGEDGLLLPTRPADLSGREIAIEDLRVQQFLITTQVPATGRTEQVQAENVRLSAPSLAGPWQIEGASGGIPFRIASGALGHDRAVTVKVSGGGDQHPRFESEARVQFVSVPASGSARALVPEMEGTARLVVGPPTQVAGPYVPFALSGKFKARGPLARFETVVAEVDPAGRTLRLAGSGQIDLRRWRAGLKLETRRLDLDAFLLSPTGQALLQRGLSGREAPLPVMVDLDLQVESLAAGLDDWSNLELRGTFDRGGGLLLRNFSATAPGATAIHATGEIDTRPGLRFTGRLGLEAAQSEGIGRYLRRLLGESPVLALLDGRPVEAGTDIAAAGGDYSLTNLRARLGGATLSGNARYASGETGTRARLDAQLAAETLDLAELPPLDGLWAGLRQHDLGLTLQARSVRFGSASGTVGGTVAASLRSTATEIAVESLEIKDLAGADLTLAGRIGPDGGGRIAGRVTAPAAAPLLALLERVWMPDLRHLPTFLRTAPLALDLASEREAGAADTLRTILTGKAGEGDLRLALTTRAGRLAAVTAELAGSRADRWFGRSDIAALRRPASLKVTGERTDTATGADLRLTVDGSVAGLTVATASPLHLGTGLVPEAGEIRLATEDTAPFAALLDTPLPPSLAAQLTLGLGRDGSDTQIRMSGRVGGAETGGTLVRSEGGDLSGRLSLGRLDLPAALEATVLPRRVKPEGAGFAAVPALPRLQLDLQVGQLELGRGARAEGTTVQVLLDRGVLNLRDLSAGLAGGRLTGSADIARRGASATVSGTGTLTGAALTRLVGDGPIGGRVTLGLRYSGTGADAASLERSLSGTGEIQVSDLRVPGADPGGIERALARALEEDDPLREGRVQALLAEEFSAAPLSARGPATAPVSFADGMLRAGPLTLDLGQARWTGTVGIDLRGRRIDARGTVTGGTPPKGWTGGAPSVQLGLTGSLLAPERQLDGGALTNGLAALVLRRELEKIELMDADQTERLRRRARIDADRARAEAERAAEEARRARLAQQAAAEEAARQVRAREEQVRAREEQARAREEEAERARRGAAASSPAPLPMDITPPAPQP